MSVCLSVGLVRKLCRNAEPTEMSFGELTYVSPRKKIIRRVRDPHGQGSEMKCSLSVQRLHSTISDQRRDNLTEWHGVHTILPATHRFIQELNEPSCINFVSIHQMASPEQCGAHLDQLTPHLSTLN